MMRETKVGLVVACAFAGLTAVVVATKFNQGTETPANTPTASEPQAKNAAKIEASPNPKPPDFLPINQQTPPQLPPDPQPQVGLIPEIEPRRVEAPPTILPVETTPAPDPPLPLAPLDPPVGAGKDPKASELPPPPAAKPNETEQAGHVDKPPVVTRPVIVQVSPKEAGPPDSPNPLNLPTAPAVPPAATNTSPPPVIGGAPSVSGPPITVPVPPGAQRPNTGNAQVHVFDEQTVYVLATDQSFADISKRVYNSDKYALALQQYNRAHLRAHETIRQEPLRLQVGIPVFVPPTAQLERLYPHALSNTPQSGGTATPPPITTPTPAKPVVSVPPPLTNGGVVPAAATSSSPDGTKLYRVAANGEMLFDIARRTLGNGDEWIRIYQLNPQVQPQFAVPAGSLLRLPADARVAP